MVRKHVVTQHNGAKRYKVLSQYYYNTILHHLQHLFTEEDMEKVYKKKEVAEMLHVHLNTVDRWIHKGWLKAHKLGYAVRIYESDLNEFLNRWN